MQATSGGRRPLSKWRPEPIHIQTQARRKLRLEAKAEEKRRMRTESKFRRGAEITAGQLMTQMASKGDALQVKDGVMSLVAVLSFSFSVPVERETQSGIDHASYSCNTCASSS
jgi:urease accessory protein UreE